MEHPVPPPHEELTRYFSPPSRVLKRAEDSLEGCRELFKVAPVVKRTLKRKAERHVEGTVEDELILPPSAKFAKLENDAENAAPDAMDVDLPAPEMGQAVDLDYPSIPDARREQQRPVSAEVSRRSGSPDLVVNRGIRGRSYYRNCLPPRRFQD